MKQINIIMLLITLISMRSTQIVAHDFEVNGMYYNIVSISELTCEVTYRGDDYIAARYTYYGNITVPEYVQYNGRSLKVIGIGDHAFDNMGWWGSIREPVTSISLPNSIEYIGRYALSYNSFSDFRVPSSLKRVGNGAFHDSYSKKIKRIFVSDLKSWCEIEFEDSSSSPFCNGGYRNEGTSVTFGLYTVEGEMYLNNELCEIITIPNEIKKINNFAFAGMASIKEIVLPEGIESIGDFAFCNCVNLLSVKTPTTCKTIGKHAFNGCSQLSKVELSEGLASIGERAFSYCISLQSLIFPSSIDAIGEYMFYGMDFPYLFVTKSESPLYCPESSLFNIRSIDFQREFTCHYWWKTYGSGAMGEIIDSPFEGYQENHYNKLKTVIIGPNVKHIHKKVFEGCSLDSVVLQNSETSFLLGYERVDSSYYTSFGHVTSNYYNCNSAFHNIPIKYLHIGRPIEVNDAELHQGATQEGAYYKLSGFFEKSVSFQEITIGNSVSDISFLMFGQYKDLSSVTFGSGIKTIPDLSQNDKLDSIVVINNIPPSAIGFANTTYLHCKLYVPKGTKAAYESADVWKNFWNIIELDHDFNSLGIQPHNISSEPKVTARYAIGGTEIEFPQRGINIIKMSDGTVKKVYVK